MSVEAITWALRQKTGDPRAKVILLCLANYADERGRCWPSQATLAEQTEQSVDTVGDRLEKLEAHSLIRREQRQRPDGGRASDVIVLLMELGLPLATTPHPLAAVPLAAGPPAAGTPSATVREHESFIDTKDKKERADARARPLPPPGPKKWVNTDDPRWPNLAERWISERGNRHCPATSGLNGMGWSFPAEWVTPPP